MKKKTLLSWSSGKDSAWALHLLQHDPRIELLGLFTVMNEKYNRVSMHATRLALLERQASAVGLPLQTIHLPDPCTNEQCDAIMRQFVNGRPIQNSWRMIKDIPPLTPESETMSKDLQKRGFKFVGPTICYAFMQAVGMVNDHLVDCFRHEKLKNPVQRPLNGVKP